MVIKRAHVLQNESLQHHVSWGGAFAEGLRRHGVAVTTSTRPAPCDLLVMWGVRNQPAIEIQRAAGRQVCILERGYMGDRFAWTSVSFGGGLNGRAEFRAPPDPAGKRFAKHHAGRLKPWRDDTGLRRLMIAGQVPGDMSLRGRDLKPWYAMIAAIAAGDGWKVYFRPHPVAAKRGRCDSVPGALTMDGTAEQCLDAVDAVVTFNSNLGVDAVLAGVPTVAMDRGSMAWDVTTHDLAAGLRRCDRSEWAYRLAGCQWNRREIEAGECWEAIQPRE